MKIYIYPNINWPIHDQTEHYKGVVPFSQFHMDLFEHVGPDEADIIYMGQIGDSHQLDLSKFPYLNKYRDKHWIDIEGDWLNREIPRELDGINLTINGAVRGIESRFNKIFVRPTFSTFLVSNLNTLWPSHPNYKSIGFQGYPDPFGLRRRLQSIMSQFPGEYVLTDNWNGPAKIAGSEHKSYQYLMLRNLFHLCPRGCGHDSVRFFESCLMEHIPIVVGDNILFGELDGLDTSFAFQISQYQSLQSISEQIRKILSIDWNEINFRISQIKDYNNYIRLYFENPTKYLLWRIYGLPIH